MPKVKSLFIIFMLMGASLPLLAQEDIFKDYAEAHHSRSYCLYPSTLRMININKNEAFDELASSFEKFLIYELDSVSAVERSFMPMIGEYRAEGFEEYMYLHGNGNLAMILGEEKRKVTVTMEVHVLFKAFCPVLADHGHEAALDR
ncbi:MAG: hypothetical protein RIC80_16340 [Cyclobacteriaceae bacterium]